MATFDLFQLRLLIGRRVSFRGGIYTVIEVLEDSRALVIAADHPEVGIQPDSYGNARRHIAQTLTIPAFTPDGTEPHPDFLDIGLV